jgi:hypothetical protein
MSNSTPRTTGRPLSQTVLLWSAIVLLIFGVVFGVQGLDQ